MEVEAIKSKEEQKAKKQAFLVFLVLGLTLFLGVSLGVLIGKNLTEKEIFSQNIERHKAGFSLISPLLECNLDQTFGEKRYKTIKTKVKNLVETKVSQKEIRKISVYFRDLNSGYWFGFEENEKFTPASLLKVPVMIVALKKAEQNPDFLQEKVKVDELDATEESFSPNIKPGISIKEGEVYSVWELIERMIINSDNSALFILQQLIREAEEYELYKDLGINLPSGKIDDFMSVKEYASFFRVLYNASYLNKQMSERALELLVQVDFKEGLAGGVPKGILVANKFGERGYENQSIKQLHDCGIIYYPHSPYLLCVMSRGDDFNVSSQVVREISRVVYQTRLEILD